ncbi:uncharacterized protein LOC128227011 isoform X2 [Mya arenaria]|uniref:uncharacterized protein LOC128227011 isoform X2 n=1 Tax=Mya arenaria TaxID=6604 RepID=UPI0022E4BD24|nr:uncharacterized protein LOC128227011 isoform X2 [Mya arenaria]
MYNSRCTCCRWLYSVYGECLVITCTFLHALMSAVEILIHFEVIKVPGVEPVTTAVTTVQGASGTSNLSTAPAPTQGAYDPGGCPPVLHENLVTVVEVVRYGTLVISALFFIEIIGRIIHSKKRFFKDPWQVFDGIIVVCSLGAEAVLFVLHDQLLCYHVAVEAAALLVLLRLWRLPRTCNIRKERDVSRLEQEMKYLRQTKIDADLKCRKSEEINNMQVMELRDLRELLKERGSHIIEEKELTPNGQSRTPNGITVNKVLTTSEDDIDGVRQRETLNQLTDSQTGYESDLARNDSDSKNSKAADSGIEVKDSFNEQDTKQNLTSKNPRQSGKRFRKRSAAAEVGEGNDDVFDSDGSEGTADRAGLLQEVTVQIEEATRQNQLPSISRDLAPEESPVVVRRRKSSFEGTYFDNRGYAGEDDDDVTDLDGSRTYKSAEGIPMTDL